MKIKKKRTVKYWIGQLHLWLGLASGLVVLIVSITGCLFVFQKEISETVGREKYFVNPGNEAVLPVSVLLQKAQAALGTGMPVNNIVSYKQPDRSWEFMAYKENDSALTYFGSIPYFKSAFINPYTGALTGIKDYKYDFFSIVKGIHWSLLLRTGIGQPIVGWSTLVFVLLLITGLVLWWPKKWTKATRDRSFKIKWKASFKRVNYDLHNVPGFYSLFPALILSLTGMVFSFRWFSALVYVAAAGTTTPPPQVVVKSVEAARSTGIPLDIAYQEALTQLPRAVRLGISPAADKEGTIYVAGYQDRETYYGADVLQFDQYSGKLLHRRNNSEKNRGERLVEMNYDIHVGAIAGLAGKIIAFIVSLICASLPVTGFLVWWNKGRARAPRPKARHQTLSATG
jgi:uncharacterized iron-regulated membrane protein